MLSLLPFLELVTDPLFGACEVRRLKVLTLEEGDPPVLQWRLIPRRQYGRPYHCSQISSWERTKSPPHTPTCNHWCGPWPCDLLWSVTYTYLSSSSWSLPSAKKSKRGCFLWLPGWGRYVEYSHSMTGNQHGSTWEMTLQREELFVTQHSLVIAT